MSCADCGIAPWQECRCDGPEPDGAPAAWFDGPMVALDLETTHAGPEEARIVTAAVVTVGDSETLSRVWLADPGVEIPGEATAVHGVSTEFARAEGRPAAEVVREVCEVMANACDDGFPLVIFNARYDLTVVDREMRRYGAPSCFQLKVGPVIDPSVIDRFLGRFRRSYPAGVTKEQALERGIPSSRTLAGMCAHYGIVLDDAHSADADALAAVRLAYRLGVSGEVVRRVRGREDAIEKARLEREWASVRLSLPRLHAWQARIAGEEALRLAAYFRREGRTEDAESVRVDWPLVRSA